MSSPVTRSRLGLLLRAAAVLPLGAAGLAIQAGIAAPAAHAAASTTVTYTGAEQTYPVPPGVTAVTVTAVGAPGGNNGGSGATGGGKGAVVTATVPVPAGATTLFVEVGGSGASADTSGSHAFNGGGADGGYYGGGGGGASDVRTVSCGSPCNTNDPASLGSRLVVAGGGGGQGGGCFSSSTEAAGGTAGDGSVSGPGGGGPGTTNCPSGPNAGGDGGFGGTAGGAGGAGNGCPDGGNGALGQGGDATSCSYYSGITAGGGGGGYYGGGAGGGDPYGNGGGGGAGSSYWASGAAGTSMSEDTTGTPEVTITPVVPADAPLHITHIAAAANRDRQAAAGVTFTDADPAGNLSQYSGTINWGDGTVTAIPHSQFVKVPARYGGGFAAGDVHRYTHGGSYTVTITINDSGGASATASTPLKVPTG